MNQEVIKAMSKQKNERKNKIKQFRKWWCKNGYKVMRIIFLPVWLVILAKDKITDYLNSKVEWSEERATEILNYYVPRYADWDEETKSFYFFDNGYGWYLSSAKKYLKRKDYRFWKLYRYDIKHFLKDNFELEGFKKEKGDCFDGWTELSFYLIENGVDN